MIINKRTDVAYPTNIIEKLGTNLISILPYDKAIIKCGLDGRVFVSLEHHSVVSQRNSVQR